MDILSFVLKQSRPTGYINGAPTRSSRCDSDVLCKKWTLLARKARYCYCLLLRCLGNEREDDESNMGFEFFWPMFIIGDWLMIMRLMLCTYCEKNHLSLGFGGMTALWKHNVNVNEFIRVFTWTWISCLSSLKGFFLTAFSVRLLQSVMQHLMLDLITFWVRMTNISLYSLIFVMIQNTVFLWFLSYWARNQMNMNCLSYPAHD